MYRIAVFSDIHGNLEALKAILNDIRKEHFDDIIFLGDSIGLGPNPSECINLLNKKNIRWILGNHDLYFIDGYGYYDLKPDKIEHYKWVHSNLTKKQKDVMRKNKLEYSIIINGYKLVFSHYFIDNISNIYPFYKRSIIRNSKITDLIKIVDGDYFFYGHEHKPSMLKINDKYLIDVGSSGILKDNNTFYTVIEIDNQVNINKKTIKYDRDKLVKKLNNMDYPGIEKIKKDDFGI